MYDIIIVGGGINGILALDFFMKKNINTIVIEKKKYLFGTLQDYMHDDLIFISEGNKFNLSENIMSVKFLKNHFTDLSKKYNENIFLNKEVTNIGENNNVYEIKTNDEKFYCKNIILSNGRSIPKPFNNINNITRKINVYKNQTILLIGSGDSSGDFMISNLNNNKIIWINKYMPPKFHRLIKQKFDKLNKKNLLILNSKNINYKNGNVYYENHLLKYDFCVCLIGFDIDTKFYLNNNIDLIKLNNKTFIKTDSSYQTNRSNIFAIGEIVLVPQGSDLGETRAYIEHTNIILKRILKKIKQ